MTKQDDADQTTVERNSVSGSGVSFRPEVVRKINAAIKTQDLGAHARNYIYDALKLPFAQAKSRVRFPSNRMGVTIDVKHGELGLAAVEKLETDRETIAYIDRPNPIKVSYEVNGRNRSFLIGPAFLVVRSSRMTVIFLLPKVGLEGQSNCYQLIDGRLQCPGAAKALAELGFDHEVWTDRSFNRNEVINARILLDYFAQGDQTEEEKERGDVVVSAVSELGGPTISELLNRLKGIATINDVLSAVARGAIYADRARSDLSRHDETRVTTSAVEWQALQICQDALARASEHRQSGAMVQVGDDILWDGVIRQVINVGDSKVEFSAGNRTSELSLVELASRLESGKIKLLTVERGGDPAPAEEIAKTLIETPKKYLDEANKRYERVLPYLDRMRSSPSRTTRRHLQRYRHAEIAKGNGYLGLIPKFELCGSTERRMPSTSLELAEAALKEKYADPRNWRALAAHQALRLQCEEAGIHVPSYSWFCRFIQSKDQHAQTQARKGFKAAYPTQARVDRSRPVCAEVTRAFECAHIDHTEIDLETVYGETGENLGRVWLTLMFDQGSRTVLALYLSYEPPSTVSVLMVMRECVRRHSRLPDAFVLDGGKEFRSIWMQTICAFYKVQLRYRRPSHPRDGATGERIFGTFNTMLFHRLQGNTQLTKDPRSLTDEVDPKRLAVWTLPDLVRLVKTFAYEEYDTQVHPALLMTPRQSRNRSLDVYGQRMPRAILYTEVFQIMTCPSVGKGTAKVSPSGVKVNNFMYYNLQLAKLIKQDIPVRYEPLDLSVVWGFVGRKWIRLTSTRWDLLLDGLSESDVEVASAVYKKRQSDVNKARLTSTSLARFIAAAEDKELILQLKKTAALRQSLAGDEDSGTPPSQGDRDDDPDGEYQAFDEPSTPPNPLGDYQQEDLQVYEL